ncbi:S-protein homolog 27-like [Punica granatum]|uniref:S-protein homolog n=1 Tax=Punica granatum TaxID=22663 RepID=A0A6P8BX54_PUNGR|nr:S-protein homolog 27-like [Punica granatum]
MSFTIHCKSKNDDLKTHVVEPGQKYGFRFRVDFFGTTLFFCGAKWHGGHVVFDIYKADRDDMYRCPYHCRWEARGDAIVGYMEHYPNPDIVIPWNKSFTALT